MRKLPTLALMLLMAVPAMAASEQYRPSPLQLRIDRSFSRVEIETPLGKARGQLKEERVDRCHELDGCNWLDRNKVRHYFWGDSPTTLWVVVKSIKASDFVGRAIPALGIGLARNRAQVLAAARKFAPELKLSCGASDGAPGRHACSATLNPGWLSFEFDARDRLTEIRFDGYHFT